MVIPLFMVVIRTTPKNVPNMDPVPPLKLAPPIITAAIINNAVSCPPEVAVAVPTLDMRNMAAIATIRDTKAKLKIVIIFTFIPANLAAFMSPPT